MCQAVYKYAKANNKYMKNYNKCIESSYIEYLDANNLNGWAMSQKLPVDGFKWIKKLPEFNGEFIKNYNEDSNKGYILEADIENPEKLFNEVALNLHSDLPFLSERKKIGKCNKLVCTVQDKENYVVHIRALKSRINT